MAHLWAYGEWVFQLVIMAKNKIEVMSCRDVLGHLIAGS
jgi:hypothetical protein